MPTYVNDTLDNGDNGSGPLPPPPVPEAPARDVEPGAEYVAGYATGNLGNIAVGAYLRSLPQYVDDLTRDFGIDLYDRMMLDDQVGASVETLVRKVLADGWYLRPALDQPTYEDQQEPDYEDDPDVQL